MAREMFDGRSIAVGTDRWYSVPLSVLIHVVALAALVVVPLVAMNGVPTPESVIVFAVTPAPPPPPPPPPQIVPVGGDIKEPRKIRDVRPVYPQVAMAARVEGIVIIQATISKEGSVIDAKVLRSQPLLDQAALDAVTQWTFTPTTLNGVPVEVLMTITVNFTLR